MKRPSQQRLAMLHDHELSPWQAKRVEEALASYPEEQKQLGRFEKMGDLIRLMSEEKCSEVAFDELAKNVSAAVRTQSRPSLSERLRVWIQEFFEHRKSIWVPTAALATACLAVVVALPLIIGAPSNENVKSPKQTPEIWAASAQTQGYSKVDSVSFGDHTGRVYQLSDGRGGTAAVVWIVDEAD